LRHAAVSVAFSVALGHHNLNLGFEQSPRPLRRGTGRSRFGASAASPVHESRNRPAVIDASIRGVLVSQVAISVGHASIGRLNARRQTSFDEASSSPRPTGPLDSMSTSSRAMNHPHISVASLRDHAADDRQAD
jgi:hypothetical protein